MQTDLDELHANWDFSGDPCPIQWYEWAIFRIDGTKIQSFVGVGGELNSYVK